MYLVRPLTSGAHTAHTNQHPEIDIIRDSLLRSLQRAVQNKPSAVLFFFPPVTTSPVVACNQLNIGAHLPCIAFGYTFNSWTAFFSRTQDTFGSIYIKYTDFRFRGF